MRINYILVVGEAEEAAGSVAVRNYKTKDQSTVPLELFIAATVDEIEKKIL